MEPTVVNQNNQNTGLMLVVPAELKGDLAKLGKMNAGLNIVPKYKEFDKGEKVRCVFAGFSQLANSDGEPLNAACWIDANGNMWQNAGIGLVGALTTANIKQGTPIEIEFEGKKKVEKGSMHLFAVRLLS